MNIKNKVETDNTVQLRNNVGGLTSAGAIYLGSDNTTNQGVFGVLTCEGVAGTALTEKFTVTDSGRVGIGESSPAELLHIHGTGPHMLIEGATNENAQIDFSSGPSYRTSRHQIESRHYALSGNGYRNWLAFNVNEGGESTPGTRMAIRGDGRVGIGTTDPASALDVKGVIKQTGANWVLTNGGVGLQANGGAHYDDFAYLNRTLSTPTGVTLTHVNQGGSNTRSRITINTAGKYACLLYTSDAADE